MLLKAGYSVGSIKKISISGHDESGRPEKLKISSSKGTLSIPPSKFRMAVDQWLIKSAFITDIYKKGKDLVFEGKGWGHGVGLCQWGAIEMAREGKKFREILTHYYPGTKLERIPQPFWASIPHDPTIN